MEPNLQCRPWQVEISGASVGWIKIAVGEIGAATGPERVKLLGLVSGKGQLRGVPARGAC
jgi:hypothetical protein